MTHTHILSFFCTLSFHNQMLVLITGLLWLKLCFELRWFTRYFLTCSVVSFGLFIACKNY